MGSTFATPAVATALASAAVPAGARGALPDVPPDGQSGKNEQHPYDDRRSDVHFPFSILFRAGRTTIQKHQRSTKSATTVQTPIAPPATSMPIW